MSEIIPIFRALLRSKAGALMLLIQIAITTAIVSNAAFIINDRIQYLNTETGYPEKEIFSFSISSFGEISDLSVMLEQTEETIRNIPGVIDASLVNAVPVSGSGSASTFGSQPSSERGEEIRAAYFTGDEHILNTLGLSVFDGRNFEKNEVVVGTDRNAVAQVAIVSKAFIDQKFPEGNGLGQTIYFGNDPLKIVGVVEEMVGPWLKDNQAQNVVIMPIARADKQQKFIVRAEADQRAAVMRQIDDILLAEHNKRVIMFKRGMDEAKDNYNASDILMLRMLVVLIVVLVLVTALGIFGMTLFNINKRTKQIGTRRALGARKSAIVKYFLTENSIICISGMLIGSVAAVFLGNSLMTRFSIPALDINYILTTAVFVLVISLVSVIFPAIRAANIAPSIATRSI